MCYFVQNLVIFVIKLSNIDGNFLVQINRNTDKLVK